METAMTDPVNKGSEMENQPQPQPQPPTDGVPEAEAEKLDENGQPRYGGGRRDHKPDHKPPGKPPGPEPSYGGGRR
jgi:hypothetical protein